MKTKGALVLALNEGFTVDEIDVGDPVAGEVQIQLHAAGMCHSDYHMMTGSNPIVLPALGGHEGAGVITKVGSGVTALAEGDHVIVTFIPSCRTCQSCMTGHGALCDRGAVLFTGRALADGSARVHSRGLEVSPFSLLGTFAPYMTVHQDSVIKIDPSVPFESAAIMGCAVPTGFGSATHIAEIRAGETAVVVGLGGIGMSALQGAVVSGAREIIGVDPVPFKREQALRFGATRTFESMSSAIEPLLEITGGVMAHKVILAVGEMRGEYIEEAMILTAKTGTVVVTGMGSLTDVDVKLNLFLLAMLQKTLKGNIFGGSDPRTETPRLVALYKSGQLKIDEMITNTYCLEEINQGYQDMLDGKNIRGIIRFTEADW